MLRFFCNVWPKWTKCGCEILLPARKTFCWIGFHIANSFYIWRYWKNSNVRLIFKFQKSWNADRCQTSFQMSFTCRNKQKCRENSSNRTWRRTTDRWSNSGVIWSYSWKTNASFYTMTMELLIQPVFHWFLTKSKMIPGPTPLTFVILLQWPFFCLHISREAW